jgi:hypothetical protein
LDTKRKIFLSLNGAEREALVALSQRERRDMRDQATLTISYETTDCDWMNLAQLQRAFALGCGFFALHIEEWLPCEIANSTSNFK